MGSFVLKLSDPAVTSFIANKFTKESRERMVIECDHSKLQGCKIPLKMNYSMIIPINEILDQCIKESILDLFIDEAIQFCVIHGFYPENAKFCTDTHDYDNEKQLTIIFETRSMIYLPNIK